MRDEVIVNLFEGDFLAAPTPDSRDITWQITAAVVGHIQAVGVGTIQSSTVVDDPDSPGTIIGLDGDRMADLVVAKLTEFDLMQEMPEHYDAMRRMLRAITDHILTNAVLNFVEVDVQSQRDDGIISGLDPVAMRSSILLNLTSAGYPVHDPIALLGLLGLTTGIVDEIENNGVVRHFGRAGAVSVNSGIS